MLPIANLLIIEGKMLLLTIHLLECELSCFRDFVLDKSESFVALRQRVPAHRDASNGTKRQKCLEINIEHIFRNPPKCTTCIIIIRTTKYK